ncbi:YaiI/YqxD family protein [Neisseriaceae bacterium CLB008]
MQIWVDADACPVVIKDILFRAAEREQVNVTLVANRPMHTPPSPYIKNRVVAHGFDEADNEIVRLIEPNDLVITADIPLASDALAKKAVVISSRGEPFTLETIQERLTMRDFMDTLRGSGIHTGGPAALSPKDRQAFGQSLDKWLHLRRRLGQA